MPQLRSLSSNGHRSEAVEPIVELRPRSRYRPVDTGPFQLLVQVTAPAVRSHETQRPPLDLAIVVDRSGSMSGGALDLARKGVEHALRVLDERDTVSVTVYDDRVDVLVPQRALTRGARETAVHELGRTQPRGSTDLAGGWLTGCDQLAPIADRSSQPVPREGVPLCRTLLLTDGLANVGMTSATELARHAAELRRRGITTSTVGVGSEFDEVLLGAMADSGGGRYHYVANAADIPKVFSGELGEILAVALRDVTLAVRAPSDWQLSLLNDLSLERGDGWTRVRLGDLAANDTRTLIWEALLPAGTVGRREEVELHLTWTDASGRHSLEQRFVHALETRRDGGEEDTLVLDELARMYAARARLEALEHNRAGRYDLAARTLRRYRTVMPATATGAAMARELDADAAPLAAPMSMAETKSRHIVSRNVTRQQKDYTRDQRC